MFAIDDSRRGMSHRESGSILLMVVITLAVASVFMMYQTERFQGLMKIQNSAEIRKTRRSWAMAIGDRVDCLRMMAPYTQSNRCPAGTARTLTYFDSRPMSPGSNNSFSLGKGWLAQVECGVNDLKIRVTRFVNGKFDTDPLTGKVLDFNHPATVVSDGGENIPICPSYFGDVLPEAFLLTMTIETQQRIGSSYAGANQTLDWTNTTCDGRLGIDGELDDSPLPGYWRKGGASGAADSPRTDFADMTYNYWHTLYSGFGQNGDMQVNWPVSPINNRIVALAYCDRICSLTFKAAAGVNVKCDPTVSPAWPATGEVVRDQATSQVNCLCLK